MSIADLAVYDFCRRPDVDLNLPEALAATLHLLRQAGYLAANAMGLEDERALNLGWTSPGGRDLREEFGTHIESVMLIHADLVLTVWYETYRGRGH